MRKTVHRINILYFIPKYIDCYTEVSSVVTFFCDNRFFKVKVYLISITCSSVDYRARCY